MASRSIASSIDEYIAEFLPEIETVLEEMRTLIRTTAPGVIETISYAMPTFDLNGKHLVHFGGFKNHIGFYPTPSAGETFKEELKGYKTGKGSVQLPWASLSPPI